jgi:hypothetical protein
LKTPVSEATHEALATPAGASSFPPSDQTASVHFATEADLPSTSQESSASTMADSNSPSIVATPYPTYISPGGDDDDDSFRAALVSHSAASVERNQDSQFAAARSQAVHRDVQDGKRETVQTKYDLAVQGKDAEIRNSDRFAEVSKELAVLRAEMNAREVAQLRVDLAESKAEGRQAQTDAMLKAILAKLAG